MFPFDVEIQEDELEELEEPWEYKVDFETGVISDQIVTGLEAIKIWVWMALQVDRYRYVIYSWDYGHEIEDLVGTTYPVEYMQSEVERIISDCLLINEHIRAISNLEYQFENSVLTASFTLETAYGEVDIDV